MHTPYHFGQRHHSPPQTVDSSRQQYAPFPPPPPNAPGGPLQQPVQFPPPPPRRYPSVAQGPLLPPPPPTAPPGVSSMRQSHWQRQPGFFNRPPPPPPPPPNTAPPATYNPNAYYSYQVQDDQPLTSARYIPTGESFGPGVGIPPLNLGGDYGGDEMVDQYEVARHNHSLSDSGPADGINASNVTTGDGQRYGFGDATQTSPAPDNAGMQWPLDRVLSWLTSHDFSKNWQETFRKLNVQGSQFLEIGRGHGGKGNFGMMHNFIYPQLAKQCTLSGSGWDQSREQEEGRRLRRLIRNLKEEPDRRMSTQGPGDRGEEPSQEPLSSTTRPESHLPSPSTAGAGESSPGLDDLGNIASQGRTSAHGQKESSSTHNTPTLTQETTGVASGIQMSPWAEVASNKLENGSSRGGHSSSRSRETAPIEQPGDSAKPTDSGQALLEGSPLLSPGSQKSRHQSSMPQPIEVNMPQQRFYGHSRGRSSESNGPRSAAPVSSTWNEFDARRLGYEGARPPSGESSARTSTGEQTNSAKDHRSIFKKVFTRGQKRDDSHPSPDEVLSQSPSSPVNYRVPTLPYAAKTLNSSDTSLDRPSSGAVVSATGVQDTEVSVQDQRGASVANHGAYRRYVFVTPDGWNYRLVDISAVESVETFKDLLRYELSLPDIKGLSCHITTPGQLEHDDAVANDVLYQTLQRADALASLKLFIKTPYPTSIATGSSSAFPVSATSASNGKGQAESHKSSGESAPDRYVKKSSSSEHIELENRDVAEPPSSAESLSQTDGQRSLARNNGPPGTIPAQADLGRAHKTDTPATEQRQDLDRLPRGSLAERRNRLKKDSPVEGSSPFGYRREKVIDFDRPRTSPFETTAREELVPHRNPPPVPPTSSTLIKANSLSKKNSSRQSWPDQAESANKTTTHDEKAQDAATRGRRRAVASGGSGVYGVASALAGAGKISSLIGAPTSAPNSSAPNTVGAVPSSRDSAKDFTRAMATVGIGTSNSGRMSPNGSPRSPGFTMSKGNVSFKIPEYETEKATQSSYQRQTSAPPSLQNRLVTKLKETPASEPHASPDVSPSTAHPPTKLLSRSSTKRGPTLDFNELPVVFKRTSVVSSHESDEDSDDGLFAVPLSGSLEAKKQATDDDSESGIGTSRLGRPSLSVRTTRTDKCTSASTDSGSTGLPSTDSVEDDERTMRQATTPMNGAIRETNSVDADELAERRKSFASDGWAPRPPPEALIEHLDEFFPNVDLDQPVVEEGQVEPVGAQRKDDLQEQYEIPTADISNFSGGEADSSGESAATVRQAPRPQTQTLAQRQLRHAAGLGRTKSIRDVVKGQYQHPGTKPSSVYSRIGTLKSGDIVRRRSTKMFGAKIEQIKPPRGSRLIQLETIPQHAIPQDTISTVPHRQRTFQWVKGQLIGKGSFGRVYLGMNTTTGELLAVKQVEVSPKQSGQDKDKMKEMVKALDQEIDTMQHLDHVNIVQYLGCERKEFSISIFLEYISGGSIGSCLRKHGKFEEPVVSSLTRQTLNGLAYLHHERILHRDLKADNILLDIDGTCKISDFGISKKADDIYGNDVTNSMQGSVFWMAPEVVRSQGKGYSAKVDIWSLGCVVLEMFAGKRPWSKEEVIGAIFKLGSLNEAPPIPDDVAAAISPAALSFMYDCFNVDPTDRPTADTLLRAPFCFTDPHFNFLDTDLYDKIRPNY